MIASSMTGGQLRAWRKQMGWTQPFAAQKIGVCTSSLRSYEKEKRSDKDKPVLIPLPIAWACAAIADGLAPWGYRK